MPTTDQIKSAIEKIKNLNLAEKDQVYVLGVADGISRSSITQKSAKSKKVKAM